MQVHIENDVPVPAVDRDSIDNGNDKRVYIVDFPGDNKDILRHRFDVRHPTRILEQVEGMIPVYIHEIIASG